MKIQITKDYDQFKLIPGNRPIDTPDAIRHINHLIELNSKENLLWMFPATITKDGYLWDGQHRREVSRSQGWDFPYIISDKTLAELGENIVALTNTAQKKWGLADFIHYFSTRQYEQYVFLTQLMETYKLPHGNILILVSGASQSRGIKRGELKIFSSPEDKQTVIDSIEAFMLLKDMLPYDVWVHSKFVGAVRTMFTTLSADKLIDEIIRSGATIEKMVNTTDYLRFFEDKVVNYRKSENNHIRFF